MGRWCGRCCRAKSRLSSSILGSSRFLIGRVSTPSPNFRAALLEFLSDSSMKASSSSGSTVACCRRPLRARRTASRIDIASARRRRVPASIGGRREPRSVLEYRRQPALRSEAGFSGDGGHGLCRPAQEALRAFDPPVLDESARCRSCGGLKGAREVVRTERRAGGEIVKMDRSCEVRLHERLNAPQRRW
jgi:hypothetical protein